MNDFKILVVGGVAAGASAAAKAARTNPGARIKMFEKGAYISFANCGLPYYLGGQVKNRGELIVKRPEDLKKKYGIETFINSRVEKIDRPSKTIEVTDLIENKTFRHIYDKLIIATGGYTFMPPIEGLNADNVFTLRTIPDVDRIDSYIRRENVKRAAVLGAGYIGVEAADVLLKRGLDVYLVEMLPQVLPPLDLEMADYVEEKMKKKGVNLVLSDPVKRIEKDSNNRAVKVVTGNGKEIEVDLVIASLGIRPDLKLAREANLEIGEYALKVDDFMRTSDPDIYAAGDVVEVKHRVTGKPTWSPLAGPANLQGKIAGENAAGGNARYRGLLRTSIVQFDTLAAAKTGLSEKEAKEEDLDFTTVLIHSSSHTSYYPGNTKIHVKLTVQNKTGKLLGAQVVGEKGVDKRIDILSTALWANMTVDDLEHLDLAYSPQFSHPLDPVNVAGAVARKKIEKK